MSFLSPFRISYMGFYFEVFLLNEKELCGLSRYGWILAPGETLDQLLSRKNRILKETRLEKECGDLLLTQVLYDFQCKEFLVLHSNSSLLPWQGAILWEYESEEGDLYPVVQLRRSFSKVFLGCYKKEEIVAHELVHVVRFAFNEPLFEELLAYQTSKSFFRRFMGPLFIYPFEATILAVCSLIAPISTLCFESSWGALLLISVVSFFLVRLVVLHCIFFLSQRKIERAGVKKSFSLAVLLRLSDSEIIKAAIISPLKTREEWKSKALKDLRFKVILSSYF